MYANAGKFTYALWSAWIGAQVFGYGPTGVAIVATVTFFLNIWIDVGIERLATWHANRIAARALKTWPAPRDITKIKSESPYTVYDNPDFY
jgi:hypothetical protein